MGHGLDDVVQGSMFPVGDPAAGGVQSHAKRFGPEHAGHLCIGETPIGNGRLALAQSDAAGGSSGGLLKFGLVMDLGSRSKRPCIH